MKFHRTWMFLLLILIIITSLPGLMKFIALSRDTYDRPPEHAFVTGIGQLDAKPYIGTSLANQTSSGRLIGVVGAWTLGNSPKTSFETSHLRLDSTFCVRFRDLDGWIIRLLADRLITGAEVLTKEELEHSPFILCDYASELLKGEDERRQNKKQQQNLNRLLRIFQAKLYPIINGIPYPEFTTSNPGQSGVYWKKNPLKPNDPNHDPDRADDLEFSLRRDLSGNNQQDVLVRLQKQVGLFNKVNLTLGIDVEELKEPLLAPSLVRPDGPKPSQRPKIVFVPWFKIVWAAFSVAGIIAFLVWSGRSTNMLRSHRLRRRPTGALQYSLSHCQLAFWFAVIIVVFFYLWLILDEVPKFTNTAFILAGISVVTAIGTSFAAGSQELLALERYNRIMARREGVDEGRLAFLVARWSVRATMRWKAAMRLNEHKSKDARPDGELETLFQQHLEMQRQLRFLNLSGQPLRRWLVDLLSENGDVTLPRIQMFVWTLVLGLVFMWHAFTKLEMPEFSAPVLALMGLSAGGFMGFRIQEVERADKSTPVAGTYATTTMSRKQNVPPA